MDTMEWLLETENPSVRFRALDELLGRGETAEALEAKRSIPSSAPVLSLLGKMHPDGYWQQKNQQNGRVLGEGTEYGSFGTTHFCLAYCAELGLDKSHPLVAKAAERYLGLQQEDGDWQGHMSCLYAYNIRTFVKLGYRGDQRVQRAIDLLLETVRPGGGYLCDMHESPVKGRKRAASAAPPRRCWRSRNCRNIGSMSAASRWWTTFWSGTASTHGKTLQFLSTMT